MAHYCCKIGGTIESKTGPSSEFGRGWGVTSERISGHEDKEREICGVQSILRNVILSFQTITVYFALHIIFLVMVLR